MDGKKFCPTQKNMENKEENAIFMSKNGKKMMKSCIFLSTIVKTTAVKLENSTHNLDPNSKNQSIF